VDVQGSAENGDGFDRSRLDAMLDLAARGCKMLMSLQTKALEAVARPD
jgi:ribonuclease PH